LSAPTEGRSFSAAVASFELAVNLERRVMGEPLGFELVVRPGQPFDGSGEETQGPPPESVAPDRFSCSPETLLAVARLLEQHETPRAYPDQAEGDAPTASEPDPPQQPAPASADGPPDPTETDPVERPESWSLPGP
jgi:hypothetical protein